MLTEIYIEAPLVDEELADQVWDAWDADETDDQVAWLAYSWRPEADIVRGYGRPKLVSGREMLF